MSRNAGGTYTLPAGNPVVTATVISSNWANTTLSDIATEMTDSLDRSGKGGMLAPLQLTDGTQAAPGLTFVTEPTSGIYRISANNIGISILNKNIATFNGQAGGIALSLVGDNSNVSVLNLTNTSLVQPVFQRFGRNGTTFDAYIGVAGAANNIITGSNQGDFCIRNDSGALIFSANGSTARASINTSNVVSLWEGTNNVAAASLMQAATYETGSFTATLTGCTTSPTASVVWTRVGNTITMNMAGNLLAASNTTACTFTGLPAGLQPARAQRMVVMLEDNGVFSIGSITLSSGSGTVTLVRGDNAAFTAAGTKGFVSFTTTHSLA